MGNLKQNKINDDFAKELSNRADDLVAEMCQYTAPYNPHKQDTKVKELSSLPLSLALLGFESVVSKKYQDAFDYAECLRSYAVGRKEKLMEHDCHLSQDSGCETCEMIEEANYLIERSENLMFAIDNME
jgi:hypothetical protein